MGWHLTIRFAWHDSKWCGKICKDPKNNFYCEGDYSLLTERIKRNKKSEIEEKYSTKNVKEIKETNKYGDNYIPPCYWCINAFSSLKTNIKHIHPYREFDKEFKGWIIKDKLDSYSVYTWPFRISFSDGRNSRYPPDLYNKIKKFVQKIIPKKSLGFFYLNFSNPISAEEMKYLLLGCGVINSIELPKKFKVKKKILNQIREKYDKNFPDFNWAIKISFDPADLVVLPYHQFIDEPNLREYIDEWKIMIDEPSLIQNFKFVCELMEDDKVLYLLYRMRKSIEKIKDILKERKTNIDFDCEKNIEKIEKFLEKTWKQRGIYPGLSKILDFLNNPNESCDNSEMAEIIIKKLKPKNHKKDILNHIFDILEGKEKFFLLSKKEESYIEKCKRNFSQYGSDPNLKELFKKLSLFNLTRFQIKRIIIRDDPEVFDSEISADKIVKNPYVLYEEYHSKNQIDRESITISDYPIDIYLIDLGMFPDNRFLSDRNNELQNLSEIGPERVRAIIADYLEAIGRNYGHCFEKLDKIYEEIKNRSLIYHKDFAITKEQLSAEKYLIFFKEKLFIDKEYFYLNYIKKAEEIVKNVITHLIKRNDYNVDLNWIEAYIDNELKNINEKDPEIYEKIKSDEQIFREQRKRCFENALKRSFSIISGKAGTGKSYAAIKIVKELRNLGENIIILTPTGRASLRLNQELKKEKSSTEAETIDMFLCKRGCYDYSIKKLEKVKKINEKVNIILDESSMIDLEKFSFLLSIFGNNNIKRLILIGDECQLPPIGLGKPFFDIVNYVKSTKNLKDNHYVCFTLNCRQKFDETILKIAEIFRRENKYFSETVEKIKTHNIISEGLIIEFWKGRDDLYKKILERLEEILKEELKEEYHNLTKLAEKLCLLFGLYKEGYVKNNDPKTLKLEKFQIITPYRGEYFGTFGINKLFSEEYKIFEKSQIEGRLFKFFHAEKIIRTENWYFYHREKKERVLLLANGSIGLICKEKSKPCLYFPDAYYKEIWQIDDPELFERAYAITVHKSQGTQFDNVFVIIPSEKKTLLSTELMYTALTRSTKKLFIFIQKKEEEDIEDIIENIRKKSEITERKTSIFIEPDKFINYRPDPNNPDIIVRSKAEYIIYRALLEKKEKGEIKNFVYENKENNLGLNPGPDFTIVNLDDEVYYWEHLGLIDTEDYYKNWKRRREIYKKHDIKNLLTTDDQEGIRQEIIDEIIKDIKSNNLKGEKTDFSDHHYRL